MHAKNTYLSIYIIDYLTHTNKHTHTHTQYILFFWLKADFYLFYFNDMQVHNVRTLTIIKSCGDLTQRQTN